MVILSAMRKSLILFFGREFNWKKKHYLAPILVKVKEPRRSTRLIIKEMILKMNPTTSILVQKGSIRKTKCTRDDYVLGR